MLQLKVCPPESKKGCQEVLDGEYDISDLDLGDAPRIIDCGANIGSFVLWAKHSWPKALVEAYEPNPDAYKLLQQNVEDFRGVFTHLTAVGKTDGTAYLFNHREGGSMGECSLKNIGEQDMTKAYRVAIIHARNLPECDLLKIDTEGSETDILFFYPHLQKCKAVVLEWHSHKDREEIRQFMWGQGFDLKEDKEWHWAGRGIQKWVKSANASSMLPNGAPAVYVCVLAGGGKVWAEHQRCIDELRVLGQANGIGIRTVAYNSSAIDRARNCQVAAALKTDATHFMFIDSDIVFNPQHVIDMVRSDLDVVSGAYPRKDMEWSMVKAAVEAGVPVDELKYHVNSHIYNQVVDNSGGMNGRSIEGIGDFVEIEEVGTGFLMFKMDVARQLIQKHEKDIAYITDYEPRGETHHLLFACQRDPACEVEVMAASLKTAALGDDLDNLVMAADKYATAVRKGKAAWGRYLTEDYAFCRLWRMSGGKIYLYLNADLGHIGTFKFEGRVRYQLTREGQAAEPQSKVGPI